MGDQYDVEDWRETFLNFDKSGNGNVESGEIGEVMRALGQNPTKADVQKILNEIDPNGEKEISFEEFVPLMKIQKNKVRSGQEFAGFCEGFKMFDRESNGMVSIAEVRHILMSMGETLTSEDCDVLLEGQEDSNGQINYEEFVRTTMDG